MSESTVPDLELRVEQVPERTYVVVRDRVPMAKLGEVIPQKIAETHAWVFANGGPAGAPMAAVGMPDDRGVVDLAVGWRVSGPLDPPAPFESVTYEPTRAVVHEYVGPFEALPETYAALTKKIAAAGLRPTGAARESYETNPEEEPDPQKWVTEIVWPVE